MDCKNVLIKFVGGFVFSYALLDSIYYTGMHFFNSLAPCVVGGTNASGCVAQFTGSVMFPYIGSILVMAVGLVLLAEDFSGCCKPAAVSKAKK